MRTVIAVVLLLVLAAPAAAQSKREKKVRDDLKNVLGDGFWIYNDLPGGIAKAKRTGKPLLVVFRCVPCEACAQLDAEIVERDKTVRKLLDKFVCVRIVHANGMDMSLFHFDYDQSFAAFLMNADKTIYGRFGTRSHQRESKDDVSIEGFAAALEGALELHKQYPSNRKALSAKRGGKPPFPVPETSPMLRGRDYGPKLNYKGNVVRSCIHCHQVGEAQRHFYRSQGKPIPEKVLFPYPHPKALGLVLDPKTRATVKSVKRDSPAARAGFKAGDDVRSLSGQPLLSMADVQWVLHNAPETAKLPAVVKRDGKDVRLTLALDSGWRRRDNISWRATSWSLRRMTTGGLKLEILPVEARRRLKVPRGEMALRVQHVGQYGAHAAAKRAGFRKGDVLVSFDGKTTLLRESDLMAYAVNAKMPGERVPVTVIRSRRRVKLTLPIQK